MATPSLPQSIPSSRDLHRLTWPALYECALASSDVDLSLRDDLASSVQDYLLRIIEELHSVSQWTRACQDRVVHCEQQHVQREQRDARERERQQAPLQQATLLVHTEMELLRRDLQLASQDVFQRCTTQIAYVQNSFRSEYDDQLADLQRRFDDKLRLFTQKTMEKIDAAHAASDLQAKAIDGALRELQTTVDALHSRLVKLEGTVQDAVPALSATQTKLHQEQSQLQRRVDALDRTTTQQISDIKASSAESLQALRATQSQLSSKLQVLRLELQAQSEDLNRKLLHLNRFLSRVTEPANLMASAPAMRMNVGAAAVASTGDCFLHAKAALPLRAVGLVQAPLGGSVAIVGYTGGGTPARREVTAFEGTLTAHASLLTPPPGREEEAAPQLGLASPRLASFRASTAKPASLHRPHGPRPDSALR